MVVKFVVLGIYFSILFLIGVVASKKIKGLSDYYVGGKNLGFWLVAFSARVTGESAWLLLGLTGMGAIAGVSAYWVVLGELLGVGISWFVMAKRFKRMSDKYDSITIPDYLNSHFNHPGNLIRIISASTIAIFTMIFVSAQIDATGKAFEFFLNLNYFTGTLLGFLIVVAYIFIGGFVAVVWSDFFQGIMMFVGLMLLPIVGLWTICYNGDFFSKLHEIDPALTYIWGTPGEPLMNLMTILGFSMIGLGFLGSPQIYVRFISVKDEEEINKGRWVAIAFTLLTDAAAVTIGLIGRYLFTEAGTDAEVVLGIGGERVLVVVLEQLMPLTLIAFYIAVVLSAIMSTIDSLLIMASSAITRDFYQQIFNPDIKGENLTKMSRMVTLLMAAVALAIAITVATVSPNRTVFWFAIFGWSGLAATFCPVIILSLFWKAYSARGAIASMIVGFACVPIFKFAIQPMEGIGEYFTALDVLAPSFVLAMLAGFVFTKIYPRKNSIE